MQVRVKTAGVVNFNGHVLEVKPGVDYNDPFAQWLYDTGYGVEVTEGEPATQEAVVEKVKTFTVGELRKIAEDLGIDHKGLKKPELQAAVEAKQAETPTEPEAAVTEGEPATPTESEAEPSE